MTRPSAKRLIKRLTRELDWAVLERPSEMPVVRITSDPKNHSHIVYLPSPENNQGTDLDHLHELGHATLCERIHPAFATNSRFPALASKRQYLPLLPALSAATDWFVCHWQREMLPAHMDRTIKKGLQVAEEILAKPDLPPVEIILDAAMLIAQAVHYHQEPIECEGVLNDLVRAFLATPPGTPSQEALLALTNRLLASYSDLRARLVPEDGLIVWELVAPDGVAPRTPEVAAGAA